MKGLAALVLASVVVGVGCTGNGGGSPAWTGSSMTFRNVGGIAVLSASGAGFNSQETVAFYSDVEPPIDFKQNFGDGSCVLETPTPAATPVYTFVDAGPTVTFTTGTAAMAVARTGSNYVGWYWGAPLGVGYSLSNAGSSALPAQQLAAANMAFAPVLASTPTVTPGMPVTLQFTPATGADYINIEVTGYSGTSTVIYRCNAPDTGSFTVPGSVTAAAGQYATFRLTATTLVEKPLGGRNFYFETDACVGHHTCCATLQ